MKRGTVFTVVTVAAGFLLVRGVLGFGCLLAASFAPAHAHLAALGGRTSQQGFLGIDTRDIAADQVAALKLKDRRGAEVIRVDHDAPAGKCGLRLHDVILSMNGELVEGQKEFKNMLRRTTVGGSITLVLSRDGQQQTVTTALADRDEVGREAWQEHITVPEPEAHDQLHGNAFLSAPALAAPTITAPPDKPEHNLIGSFILGSSYTGAALEMIGPQLAQYFGSEGGSGLLVRSVDPNSPAADAGIRAGDVVVRANALVISSTTEWSRLVHVYRGKPLQVVLVRDKQEHTVSLIPDAKKRSSLEHVTAPLLVESSTETIADLRPSLTRNN